MEKAVVSRPPSGSSAQQEAEETLLSGLASKLGLKFDDPRKFKALNEILEPHAIDREKKVLVETCAHIGKLTAAQSEEMKGTLLKLLFAGEKLGSSWRKVMCFADDGAAQIFTEKSWMAKAASEIELEIYVIPLPKKLKQKVLAKQHQKKKKKGKSRK